MKTIIVCMLKPEFKGASLSRWMIIESGNLHLVDRVKFLEMLRTFGKKDVDYSLRSIDVKDALDIIQRFLPTVQ